MIDLFVIVNVGLFWAFAITVNEHLRTIRQEVAAE